MAYSQVLIGFTVDAVKAMLEIWEKELESSNVNVKRIIELIVVGGAINVLVGGALCGEEVLLLKASELVRRWLDGKDHEDHPHVVIPLMRHFKNETGEHNMLLVLASKMRSGMEI